MNSILEKVNARLKFYLGMLIFSNFQTMKTFSSALILCHLLTLVLHGSGSSKFHKKK